MNNTQVLVINPGSTSTKVAGYIDDHPLFTQVVVHPDQDLRSFKQVMDQESYRHRAIWEVLQEQGQDLRSFQAIIGRGGLLRPIPGGVYAINQAMLADLRSCAFGIHASNLGAILAYELAEQVGLPSFIADPVVVDELDPRARFSGHPDIQRRSVFHALNHKAVAQRYALERGQEYAQLKLIVAHLGGGISIAAHCYGQVVDVNNALDGEGPFAPERSGALPGAAIVEWCFAPGASKEAVLLRIAGNGGLKAYVQTNSGVEVAQRMLEGDLKAIQVMEAMAYQVAKAMGAMAVVLQGQVDALILTGGLAHNHWLVEQIKKQIAFLGPVVVYAGEDEMLALAHSAQRALGGTIEVRVYPPTGE